MQQLSNQILKVILIMMKILIMNPKSNVKVLP